MLKVSPRKGVIRFEKQGKLNPRYIRPLKILERIGLVAYKLELPEELKNVHNTFYVSNLKKCLSDESLVIPIKELRLDDKLNFVEEPVEVIDREVRQWKQSRIPIVKWEKEGNKGYGFLPNGDQGTKRWIRGSLFGNGLKPYDGEINLGVEGNMISNEYAVKLCLEHEVKRGNKVVKKELIVALRGEIYFVEFIIITTCKFSSM
nr:putative reverse transcriptase domain-containing protein [Tanacetum cinerariifolium]